LPSAARKTLRPMRPKPLMPTLTAMCDSPFQIGASVVLSLVSLGSPASEMGPKGNSTKPMMVTPCQRKSDEIARIR
jgi:hypothetical protein